MPTIYSVTPETLSKFQEPFGKLIQGTAAETMEELKTQLQTEKPPAIISVGDTVSRNLHKHGILPLLSITDNRSMRRELQPQGFPAKNRIQVKNPQGKITSAAITAIRNSLETDIHTHILVDGEEDLLTLIAVLYAKENSLVVYGQPRKGIVVVKVTPAKRAEAKKILEAMQTTQEE
jgi:uncharacterized protein (UPF0218 family)